MVENDHEAIRPVVSSEGHLAVRSRPHGATRAPVELQAGRALTAIEPLRTSERARECALVARVEGQVATLRANLTNILDLAGEVKDHTIDKILENDDLALGLDVLLGKHRL